jgi:EAL domain-containing protein (putative c-di-GMP-specific phosphodiesterase class I)/CHASE2 domain-containing sensor protein
VHTREDKRPERKPWRLLLWVAAVGLIFGLFFTPNPLEDVLRGLRNRSHRHGASGDIVLVKIDNESLQQVGRWPWPRHEYAQLVDQLTKAGARRIFFDLQFYAATDAANDQPFADAIRRSGRVTLAVGGSLTSASKGEVADQFPLPLLAKNAQLGATATVYDYNNTVWRLRYAVPSGQQSIPEFSALISGRSGNPNESFMIDYSIDPRSVPAISADKILSGQFDPRAVAGKDIVIGSTSNVIGDIYFIPGLGQAGGVYNHILGAETLKTGAPLDLGWLPDFLLCLLAAAAALLRKRIVEQALILSSAAAFLLFGTALFEAHLIFLDITPGLLVVCWVGASITSQYFRRRGFVDEISGLPNLVALRSHRDGREKALVAARVLNFTEIASALPADKERQLVEQIVGRLSVGAPNRILFHGDGGIFAWFDDPTTPFGHHLEALSALFRNPVKVDRTPVDVSVAFGVEIGSSRSLPNRLASALVAADEAAHHGLKWKYHDPESLENASWKLSMLGQLDEAIDRGEVWIAFQPQLDLSTNRITGAEALARWTHPEKGPIAASEFVAAAEQSDRIGKLTAFVLEQAILTAASINKRGATFDIAVNLSGKLLSDKTLVKKVAVLLQRHGLDPKHLTLELTESAALTEEGQALDSLTQLRDMGVTISIDDYGTGFSTLEYLRTIPAAEIKIDQSFVKGMVDNRSDRLMVQSTIALAHSLGRRVVAEGVENRELLDMLTEMGCDIGQGFVIGRPMSLESLRRRLSATGRQAA